MKHFILRNQCILFLVAITIYLLSFPAFAIADDSGNRLARLEQLKSRWQKLVINANKQVPLDKESQISIPETGKVLASANFGRKMDTPANGTLFVGQNSEVAKGHLQAHYAFARSSDALRENLVKSSSNLSSWHIRIPVDQAPNSILNRQIAQVFEYGLNRIQACWARVSLAYPQTDAKMSVRLVVGSHGRVERITQLADTLDSAELDKCVVALLQRIRLPNPIGERIFIDLPLDFFSAT